MGLLVGSLGFEGSSECGFAIRVCRLAEIAWIESITNLDNPLNTEQAQPPPPRFLIFTSMLCYIEDELPRASHVSVF